MSILALVISVTTTFIGIINHKRVISKCCGRQLDASIDINNTSPILVSVPQSNPPSTLPNSKSIM